MNFAIILSGGIGTRMKNGKFPKQYIEVEDKMILEYTLDTFSESSSIDSIVIVMEEGWKLKLSHYLLSKYTKIKGFAKAGKSRQESILNGLIECINISANDSDAVMIHDAVRPLLSQDLIVSCFKELDTHDGCMPAIPVKDTIYYSDNGKEISNLLDRTKLYAGQAPEVFKLKKYYELNKQTSIEHLHEIRGTSEIAFEAGFNISIISGEESNFKITTPSDLKRFETIVRSMKE